MWSDQVEYIQLQKEDRGLGFSILDYLVSVYLLLVFLSKKNVLIVSVIFFISL